jgi:hypothetical protein
MPSAKTCAAMAAYRINLVDKNDAGSILFCLAE